METRTSPPVQAPSKSSPSRATQIRFLAVAALLLGEIFLLRRRFTTDSLAGTTEWWTSLVWWTRFNVPWGLCVSVAFGLIGGARLRQALRALGSASDAYPNGLRILAHPAAFAAFYLLTAALLEGDVARGAMAVPWLVLWILGGCALLASLAWIAFPPRAVAGFLKRMARTFGWAVVVGTAALAAGAYLAETMPFWRPLARSTLEVAHFLLGPFVEERIYDPTGELLGTPEFPVHVTRYCSGYEGISLFFVFYTAFLFIWRHRLRFPNALVLLPIGMTAVWLLNAVRIAVLIYLGTVSSPELAIDGFHAYAGWPLICLVSLGAIAMSTRIPYFAALPMEGREEDTVNPTAIYLAPLLVLIGTQMVTGAFTATPEATYPLRILAALVVLWWCRLDYESLHPSRSWNGLAIGGLGAVLWILLHRTSAEDPFAWQETFPRTVLTVWWSFKVLGFVLIVPVIEELAFRGYLLRRLVSPDFEAVRLDRFRWLPFVVSSVLFGALHDAWVVGTLMGMLFALAAHRRGRLGDAIVAHAATNALLLLFAVITGNWRVVG